jgi:hypothetical protein
MDNLLPHQNLSLEDIEGEIWKDIDGYDGCYQISSFGRVKSLSREMFNGKCYFYSKEKILKVQNHTHGYYVIGITYNNKKNSFYVHRLVAHYFIYNPKNKREVNHIDFIKLNNNVENLEWVSSLENKSHIKIFKPKTSIYVGVYYNKRRNRNCWESSIQINYKKINLGSFETQEEAYQVRCEYEKNNNIKNKYI